MRSAPYGSLTATLRRTAEQTERRIVELHKSGKTQRGIADELGMPRSTVAVILKRSVGYESPRAKSGRISAHLAAQQHGLKLWTLRGAIDFGLVRGDVTVSGKRRFYTVDPVELEEDLADRAGRRCTYPGCTAEALVLSAGERCFSHTGAVTLPGHAPKGSEERTRMSAGKVGLVRPDVAERYRHDWRRGGPLTRGLFYDEDGAPKPYFNGETRRDWKRRWRAPEVAKLPRKRGYSDAQLKLARQLKKRDPHLGRDRLARLLNVTPKQARAILAELQG
jgi:hypothetical protein